MGGRMDGRKKWQVGVPPKKNKGHKRIFFDAIGKKRKQNWKGQGQPSQNKFGKDD